MATRQNLASAKCTMFRKLKKSFKTTWKLSVCYFYFVILVDFAFELWYKPLTLYGERYQKYISVKISFSLKTLCEVLTRCYRYVCGVPVSNSMAIICVYRVL